ncbi:MAG: DUF4040 domain-containing protein [Synechococcus sp. TMED20]|nr:MAG: DUF4040 domain-containing protein [Synechococcus sp. TMED20]
MPTRTLFLLPVELVLPILGILLIRTQSPIRGLIYRSFLGSLAALLYAIFGAPDVALTEVLVGTLLSSILYIITIRACYSAVIVVSEDYEMPQVLMEHLKSMFSELRMNIVLQPSKLTHSRDDYNHLFSSKTLAGSPHAILDGNQLCIESPILLEELLETDYYRDNQFLDKIYCVDCQSDSTTEEIS